MDQTIPVVDYMNPDDPNCSLGLKALDAFLYGLPAGLLLAGLLLLCFFIFGQIMTRRPAVRHNHPSASSGTNITKDRDPLGRKNRRGPPPSSDLRPLDVYKMALQDDAPDDIKEVALASKMAKMRTTSKTSRSQ